MTYLTISTEAVSVHRSLKRWLQQLGSEAEGGDAIALVGVANAIANKTFLTLRG